MKRLLALTLVTLLTPGTVHAATATTTTTAAISAPAITIGYLPLSTREAEITLRGTAPRGGTLRVSVNGEFRDQVIAMTGMDVYIYPLRLDPGENRITVALETDPQVGTAATIYRVTASFADMAGHPLREDVEILATLSIVSGMGEGQFAPNAPVTRAQFAKFLALSMGLPTPDGAPAFADSESIAPWAVPYVAAVVGQGWLRGYPDGTFAPNAFVTRLEMAVAASRALRSRGIDRAPDGRPFLDQSAVPAWAAADVSLAMSAGVISQTWLGRMFEPDRQATRAETAAAIRRLRTAVGPAPVVSREIERAESTIAKGVSTPLR